jgi:hypothetical protein
MSYKFTAYEDQKGDPHGIVPRGRWDAINARLQRQYEANRKRRGAKNRVLPSHLPKAEYKRRVKAAKSDSVGHAKKHVSQTAHHHHHHHSAPKKVLEGPKKYHTCGAPTTSRPGHFCRIKLLKHNFCGWHRVKHDPAAKDKAY